jgi:hypothetical protein
MFVLEHFIAIMEEMKATRDVQQAKTDAKQEKLKACKQVTEARLERMGPIRKGQEWPSTSCSTQSP